jgi:hypothetical protein
VSAALDLLPQRTVVRRKHEEADLQAQVMAFLRVALPPDAIAHHSPGEGKRTQRAQGELKRSGYQTGWPDVEIVWRGRVYFIELKSKHGVLSAEQRATHRRLIYCGADVMLCKSLPEVEAALREATLPLRASVAA